MPDHTPPPPFFRTIKYCHIHQLTGILFLMHFSNLREPGYRLHQWELCNGFRQWEPRIYFCLHDHGTSNEEIRYLILAKLVTFLDFSETLHLLIHCALCTIFLPHPRSGRTLLNFWTCKEIAWLFVQYNTLYIGNFISFSSSQKKGLSNLSISGR